MVNTAFDPTPRRGSPWTEVSDADAVAATRERHVRLVYEVARRAGLPTWLDAATTIRATLRALGEWLDEGLRRDIAHHLPDDHARALLDADVSLRRGDLVALYRRVASVADDDTSLHEVALRCAAVLAVLGETLPAPLVDRLATTLPDDISALVMLPTHRA